MKNENQEITSTDVIDQIESSLEDYELDNSQKLMMLELWKLRILEEEQDQEYSLDDDIEANEDDDDDTSLDFDKLDRQVDKHKGQEFDDSDDDDIEANEDEFDKYEDFNDEIEKKPLIKKPIVKRKIMGRPPLRKNSISVRKP